MKRLVVFLLMVALSASMAGCFLFPPRKLEIRTWHDLNAVRNNLRGHYLLMNNLDSTTPGYDELASPTANEGKGWHPIVGADSDRSFRGIFDGQGYEIRDLFINLPRTGYVGLFSIVGKAGRIEDTGVVNAVVTSTAYVGSLAGLNKGTVNNCYSSSNVTGDQWVGGLVGQNDGAMTNCYSTGSVTTNSSGGGLVGGNPGTVNNSYATSNVTAQVGVGGLIAVNSGTVSNSYSTGRVTGNSYTGGLVGYGEGAVNNCFWDIETSGQATSAGGTSKTTAQMKDIATFSGAGWNIMTVANPGTRNPFYIWNIVNGVTYPFLSWQP